MNQWMDILQICIDILFVQACYSLEGMGKGLVGGHQFFSEKHF